MDGARFDAWTRTLAISRRGLVRTVFGAVAAGLGGAAIPAAAQDAARKPPGFERLGKRCDNGQACGVHTPCDGTYCAPVKCWIGGQVVDHLEVNGDNPCQRCVALEHNGAWARWSRVRDGQPCAPGDDVEVCESTFAGACAGGECVPALLPDGTACGDGQTCCQGDCCAAGVPCSPTSGCGGCDIGGAPIAAGASNPANACQACDALVNQAAWSPKPGNPPCGGDLDRVCCNGACCPPDQGCSSAGLCEPRQPVCTVNGAWCGPNSNQGCCNGECCAYGQYCGTPDACACCPAGEHCNGGVCEPW